LSISISACVVVPLINQEKSSPLKISLFNYWKINKNSYFIKLTKYFSISTMHSRVFVNVMNCVYLDLLKEKAKVEYLRFIGIRLSHVRTRYNTYKQYSIIWQIIHILIYWQLINIEIILPLVFANKSRTLFLQKIAQLFSLIGKIHPTVPFTHNYKF
jgi:hypothetical protein